MHIFLESFLPLFVAMNVMGVLPLFIGMTDGLAQRARRRLVYQAMTTAFVVAVLILFAGQLIFQTLGITVNDLRVGGGLILLVLSINDLIFGDYRQRKPSNGHHASENDTFDENDPDHPDHHDLSIGIVPIGIPLTIGPAAITVVMVSQQSFGYLPTLLALVANLAIVMAAFLFGPALLAKLGKNTSKAIAKVASLFLAAIAVAMIRVGVAAMIAAG